MKSGDRPLTARELARLLRAFAHMIETAEEVPAASPRRPRRRRAPGPAPETPADPAQVVQALRRAGVLA